MHRYVRLQAYLFCRCLPNLINRRKALHQRLPARRPHARDAVQHALYLILAAKRTMIFDSKTVRLIPVLLVMSLNASLFLSIGSSSL